MTPLVLPFGPDLDDSYAEKYKAIRSMMKRYANQPVQFVGIMSNHDPKHIEAAVQRDDLPWTVIPQTVFGPLQRDWGIEFFPTIYVVDRSGVLHGDIIIPNFVTGFDTTQLKSLVNDFLP